MVMQVKMASVCRVGFALSFLSALGCAPPLEQSEANESREVQTIVRTTVSPFCPGKTLDSCPSPKAGEWRLDIREWVMDGVPEIEIRERLQARAPGFDLSIPPVKSGGVIPVVAVALSTLWFLVMAQRFRLRSRPRFKPHTREDPALDNRLDEELALLD